MSYANQILDLLRQMEQVEFAKQPTIIFMGLLRKHLMTLSFSAEDAEEIVSSVPVKISDGIFTTAQLEEAAVMYGSCIGKIRDALREAGFTRPLEAIKAQARSMTFEV